MDKNIIIGKGILKFDPVNKTKKHDNQSAWKKIAMVMINDDTHKYYQWLIEREYKFIQGKEANTNWMGSPLRGPHVTIINERIDDISIWNDLVEKYDNTELYFFYNIENGLRNNGKHIYYKIDCPVADQIRQYGNLGDPYFGYHLTIGLVPSEVNYRKDHIELVQKYMMNNV